MHRTLQLDQSQLFLDDRWIAESAGVSRQWHQPRKYPQPVLVAEHPWERWCPSLYGTVLHWRGLFRMWYGVHVKDSLSCVCYAESEDGVAWRKPMLRLHEFQGSKENNIVLTSSYNLPNSTYAGKGCLDCSTIIDDPEDEEWPLKALMWDGFDDLKPEERGIYAARSKDGLHWDRSLGMVLPSWGDRFNAVSVKLDGKYVVYGRAPGKHQKARTIWRTESENLVQWSAPTLVFASDIEDPPLMQYYSATAFPYESMLLGSLDRMHMVPDKIDTEITWSDDGGFHWQRARTRPPFIPWGPEGSFDSTWINLPSNGPIQHKSRLWFYYSGRSGGHSMSYPLNHGGIGLALLRVDGFASIRADDKTGYVLTQPILWPGGDIHINVDPRRDLTAHPRFECGEVRVEIRDENNHPVEGFTFDQCMPIIANTLDEPNGSRLVTWNGGKSLRELSDRPIRLAFSLRDAHLYSFRASRNEP